MNSWLESYIFISSMLFLLAILSLLISLFTNEPRVAKRAAQAILITPILLPVATVIIFRFIVSLAFATEEDLREIEER